MPTQIGELGVTFPDNTVQTTAAIAGGAGFGGAPNASIYTATGFWICPPGIYKVRVTVVGGGGGAYGYGAGEAYISGGPGGCAIGLFAVTPGTTYSLVVGTGGVPGASNPGGGPPGGTGGTSSFASFCSATGGTGGTFEIPGFGGTGLNGNIRNSQFVTISAAGYSLAGGSYGMSTLTTGLLERLENGASPQAWSISSPWVAGAAGNGTYGSAGMNGAVMIEWWG
jgi:hypothetical protein